MAVPVLDKEAEDRILDLAAAAGTLRGFARPGLAGKVTAAAERLRQLEELAARPPDFYWNPDAPEVPYDSPQQFADLELGPDDLTGPVVQEFNIGYSGGSRTYVFTGRAVPDTDDIEWTAIPLEDSDLAKQGDLPLADDGGGDADSDA